MIVAVFACALGAARVWPWVQDRRARARRHERDAVQWRQAADWSAQRQVTVRRDTRLAATKEAREDLNYYAERPHFYYWEHDDVHSPISLDDSQEEYRDELTAICRERALYHERMARKWSWGAWFPWTDVPHDAPRPPVERSISRQS